MTTKTVGKLDNWGDGDVGGSDFMQLEEGSNPVRLVTSPYQFYIHWTEDATGANRKVRCSIKDCPLCQRGEKASARWYVMVVNRKTEKPAVLEMGPQIFKQVVGLSKKPKWGDPRKFDLDIERMPKGSQPLYVVSPEPHSDLTDDEIGMLKGFKENVDLNKMTAAPTPAEIREKIGLSDPEEDVPVNDSFEDTTNSSTDDDDDFNFDD